MPELLDDLLKDAVLLMSEVPKLQPPQQQKEWLSTVYGTVGLARQQKLLDLGMLAGYQGYAEYLRITNIWCRSAVWEDVIRASALLDDFIKYCENRTQKVSA